MDSKILQNKIFFCRMSNETENKATYMNMFLYAACVVVTICCVYFTGRRPHMLPAGHLHKGLYSNKSTIKILPRMDGVVAK